ncbi:Gfo/Idh/MocA family protein [Pseudomonas sp. Marseille-Q5117]|uniref:Gfo/Idh/MocA family protein n=1 Tax=Pseudomonas sp. Marseille-Q5117 TaxID=2972777 RepID=UPI0021C90CBE|nr:Gfo/Idh/MocA family oxidoreductase [Pseudomonas sp. Marseille-Q5117]
MNICMIGHGMMGTWHSQSLQNTDCVLHTLVGREAEATEAFAREYGYRHWFVDYQQALRSPEIDIVIIAGPSQSHAQMALAALEQGKHVLVEIPLALSLEDCERIVDTAKRLNLTVGVVHPMRFRREHRQLVERLKAGTERVLQVQSRLFLHRRENVGSTGLKRCWTDNLLWHHGAHLVDVALWLTGNGDPAASAASISNLQATMPVADEVTGIPMELAVLMETEQRQSMVCTGSYNSPDRIFDIFVITDCDSYRLNILDATLKQGTYLLDVDPEQDNNAQVARDFVAAVRDGREPLVPAHSVLPAMRLLHRIEQAQIS